MSSRAASEYLGAAVALLVGAFSVLWLWYWRGARKPVFRRVCGFAELAREYDGFILDAYGVLRDAERALPGALDCVTRLSGMGKKLAVVSNSTSLDQAEQLQKLGIDPGLFSAIVTSGSVSVPLLTRREFGRTCVLFTWRPEDVKKDLEQDIELGIASVEEADFILAQGTRLLKTSPSIEGGETDVAVDSIHYRNEWPEEAIRILERGVERGLPLVCLNPDVVSVQPDGTLKYQSGAVAKKYEELGGHVKYYGKPNASIFEVAIDKMKIPKERIAHVGDSLHHDVQGAANTGVDSIFVSSGIHGASLGVDLGSSQEDLSTKELEELFQREGVTPNIVSLHFRWE